jgi:hypothetical protein
MKLPAALRASFDRSRMRRHLAFAVAASTIVACAPLRDPGEVINTPVSNAPIVVHRRTPIILAARRHALEFAGGDPAKPKDAVLTIDVSFEPEAGAAALFIGSEKNGSGACQLYPTSAVESFQDVSGKAHALLVRKPAVLRVKYVNQNEFELTVAQGDETKVFELEATRGESATGEASDLATRALMETDNQRVTEVTVDMLKRKAVFYVFHY